MAASDNLNPKQFERYGSGYYAKPANVAVAAKPKYFGLSNLATQASQQQQRNGSGRRQSA